MSLRLRKNCKVNEDWFLKKDSMGYSMGQWCSKKDVFTAFCRVCCVSINCRSKGYQAITQHSSRRVHIENVRAKLAPLQMRLTRLEPIIEETLPQTSSRVLTFDNSIKLSALKAELVWAMFNIINNFSAASCNNISNIFKVMFPGDIANNFSMGRTKIGYLISEALGPYFRQIILKDIGVSYYSLLYDETTNSEGKKELQIAVRYFSQSKERVLTLHLETIFLNYATGENIVAALKQTMDKANLPIVNLLMLGSDGPNVNKKVFRLFNEYLKLMGGRALVDIGSCSIHIIHNSFLKGLNEFGDDVSDLIINLFYFFNDFPTRWEDFTEIQTSLKLSNKKFLKHISTRWLTILPATERVVEQWPAIVKYFIAYVPEKRKHFINLKKYKVIVNHLKKVNMKAECMFVIESATLFTKFTALFQRDEPLIHLLYDELKSLLLLVASRICKDYKNTKFNDLFLSGNIIDIQNIKLESCIALELSGNEKKVLEFKKNVRDHYIKAGEHLLKKSPIYYKLIKHLSCLKPTEIKKNHTINFIKYAAESMKLDISHISAIVDEWRMLQLEQLPQYDDCSKIDEYWCSVINIHPQKYRELGVFIKAALALSHGNAAVERGFSRSKLMLTDDKTNMSLRTLNARLDVASGLQFYEGRPDLVPITPELLKLAKLAHKSHCLFIEQEKAKELENRRLKDEAELIKKRNEELLNNAKKSEIKIKELETNLNRVKEAKELKQKSADKLLEEGNSRLIEALQNQNLNEAQIAQGLIDGALSLRKQERDAERNVESILKRKNALISDFFTKKHKPNE